MIDVREILDTLPHRFPMLLVDRIVEISEDRKRCRAIKNVTINEPFFQGHYPGYPIMPGVMILECMSQCGAVILLTSPLHSGTIPLIGAFDNVKFKRPVFPGDQLVVDCEILWVRGAVGKMKSCATVDGEVVATMEVTFKLKPKDR